MSDDEVHIRYDMVSRRRKEWPRFSFEFIVRILCNGPEFENVIGKEGETLKHIKHLSGVSDIITDGSIPERILITGETIKISKATEIIGQKIEENFNKLNGTKSHLTLNLIIGSHHCGMIIGKGGKKIKEIRESSGAVILVRSNHVLPNSTESTTESLVSITGTPSTVSHCVYLLSDMMFKTHFRFKCQ